MDNKKLKKLDAKRIALGQVWERDYLKKSAKLILDRLDGSKNTLITKCDIVSRKRVIRICKALIKAMESRKWKKN